MATLLRPSSISVFAITAPWRTSDGAVRKYRFFGSVFASSSAGEVFAGENCTTPAPVILSMTLSDTEDDAAPTMASAFASSSLSVCAPAMSGVPSPESALTWTTSLPSTPPAALMSSTAVCTPANSGGPRNARSPVCGSRVPIVRVPSPFLADELEPPSDFLSSELDELPQAVSTRAAAARTAAARQVRLGRIIDPPCWEGRRDRPWPSHGWGEGTANPGQFRHPRTHG